MRKTKAEMRAEMEALTAGVQPRKVAEGAGLGLTHRQWYRAARDIEVSRVVEDYGIAEALAEREHDIGAAHGVEGVNDFRLGVAKHGGAAMLGWEK